MYFEIDEEDRIVICPDDEEDLRRLKRAYDKLRQEGWKNLVIYLDLPKSKKGEKYYEHGRGHDHLRGKGQEFGFRPNEKSERDDRNSRDVYSHYPFWITPPFWLDRYGYDRSGEYGRDDRGRNDRMMPEDPNNPGNPGRSR